MNMRKLIIILLFEFSLSYITFAQKNVICFSGEGKYIYAMTNYGIFRSTNYGKKWKPHNVFLCYPQVAISSKDKIIYISSGTGLFSSDNHCDSWSKIWNTYKIGAQTETKDSLYYWPFIRSLAIQDSLIFVGTSKGIYLTTNEGRSWKRIYYDVNSPEICSVAISDKTIIAGTSKGIVYSTNYGNSWIRNTTSDSINEIEINNISVIGNCIFAISNNTQLVFSSTDNGNSWRVLSNLLIKSKINNIIGKDNLIFWGTENEGIFVSIKDNCNWAMMNKKLEGMSILSLMIKNGRIFASTNMGDIFVSRNNGKKWIKRNKGLIFTTLIR